MEIDFNTLDVEMARVDTDDTAGAVPKVWQITGTDSLFFKEIFNAKPSEERLRMCKDMIKHRITRNNSINDNEHVEYIDRVVGSMTEDQISDMEQSPYPYILKVEKKVNDLLEAHRIKTFELWFEHGKIVCRPNYVLNSVISPTSYTTTYPKSPYTAEEDVNEYERKVVWNISNLDNVKWWHRNISRRGFQINGAVHAYPDLLVMTNSGKLLMVETKGDHLENDESKAKAKIGHQWANSAGDQYRYYMVFESKSPDWEGACSFERFMEIVRGL